MIPKPDRYDPSYVLQRSCKTQVLREKFFIYLIKLSWNNTTDCKSMMWSNIKQWICVLIAIIPIIIMGLLHGYCICINGHLKEGWQLPLAFISGYSWATIYISPYKKVKYAAEKSVEMNANKIKQYIENKMLWG